MRRLLLTTLILVSLPALSAPKKVLCGSTAVCKAVAGKPDDCTMVGGTSEYFEKGHPGKPQGDATYFLLRVSIGMNADHHHAVCWYSDPDGRDKLGFTFNSFSNHWINPVYSGKPNEWVGDATSYVTCDPNTFVCEMKAIY